MTVKRERERERERVEGAKKDQSKIQYASLDCGDWNLVVCPDKQLGV
jgi:hypothetical protein